MSQPQYEEAKAYAIGRLETELPPDRYYHSVDHTRNGVIPAAVRLAKLSGIKGEELQLLAVAAAYHDIGFIYGGEGHELSGARIAAQTLTSFGFTSRQIERVMGLIMATRVPQGPNDFLEEILVDADLDVLGRDDYPERKELLRLEMAAYGQPFTLEAWEEEQLRFLTAHKYFTAAARSLRDPGKQKNIASLEQRSG